MAKQVTYDPAVFERSDIEAAKRIILTRTAALSTDARWARETPYLAELFGRDLGIGADDVVLDYGSGIGRISKALIERFGCAVVAVDLATSMRAQAPLYVRSERFSIVSRSVFAAMTRQGFRAHKAVAVWVLQHCAIPADDVSLIRRALPAGAPLAVVNSHGRFVPSRESGWVNDGVSVEDLLAARFERVGETPLDPAIVGEDTAAESFYRRYRAR